MANQLIYGINYSLDDTNHTASVIKLDSGTYTGDVIIPDSVTYNSVHYKVTSIGESAFYMCGNLISIDLPYSVKSINNGAFSYCIKLTSVTLSNGLVYIKSGAFSDCTGLTTITIPNSVINIDADAFSGCTSLISIIIPNNVYVLGRDAFNGCTHLQSVILSENMHDINIGCFQFCSNLVSVIIPKNINNIHDYAFSGCTRLVSIILPNTITDIGISAFYNCTSLTSITIPNNVIYIGGTAFNGCTHLQSVIIQSSLLTNPHIASSAFNLVNGTFYLPLTKYTTYSAFNGKNIIIVDTDIKGNKNSSTIGSYEGTYGQYLMYNSEYKDCIYKCKDNDKIFFKNIELIGGAYLNNFLTIASGSGIISGNLIAHNFIKSGSTSNDILLGSGDTKSLLDISKLVFIKGNFTTLPTATEIGNTLDLPLDSNTVFLFKINGSTEYTLTFSNLISYGVIGQQYRIYLYNFGTALSTIRIIGINEKVLNINIGTYTLFAFTKVTSDTFLIDYSVIN